MRWSQPASTGFRFIRFWRLAASMSALSTPSSEERFGTEDRRIRLSVASIPHSAGLLRASFSPPGAICAVRALWRHCGSLIQMAAEHIMHIQKSMDQMNLPSSRWQGNPVAVQPEIDVLPKHFLFSGIAKHNATVLLPRLNRVPPFSRRAAPLPRQVDPR